MGSAEFFGDGSRGYSFRILEAQDGRKLCQVRVSQPVCPGPSHSQLPGCGGEVSQERSVFKNKSSGVRQ